MKLKKFLAVVLASVMILSSIPFASLAGIDILAQAEETAMASGTCGDNLTWVLYDDGTLVISGTGEMDDCGCWWKYRDSIITVIIENGVTSIGDEAFCECKSLSNVIIPKSVLIIGYRAFEGCENIKEINIPVGVKTIGTSAFEDCDSLTNVTIPYTVTSIGEYAFDYCNNLMRIDVDNSNKNYSSDEYGVLFNKEFTTLIQFPDGNLQKTYSVPNSVITIGRQAFEGSANLEKVTIPESVTTIDDWAFHCKYITQITVDKNNPNYSSDEYGALFNKDKTKLIRYPVGNISSFYSIPNGVTTVLGGAFEYCDNIISITIPTSVRTINWYAFNSCPNLKDVYYLGNETQWENIYIQSPNGNLTSATIHYNSSGFDSEDQETGTCGNNLTWTIYDNTLVISGQGDMLDFMEADGDVTDLDTPWASYVEEIEKVIIENGITSVGSGAFAMCTNLTEVVLPEGITRIGAAAFGYCLALTSINLPDSIKEIGYAAFLFCISIEELVLPDSIESIEEIAFSYCVSIKELVLPDSIESIGQAAFAVLPEIKKINIPVSLEYIGEDVFEHALSLKEIIVPEGVKLEAVYNINDTFAASLESISNYSDVFAVEINFYKASQRYFDEIEYADAYVYLDKNRIKYVVFAQFSEITEILPDQELIEDTINYFNSNLNTAYNAESFESFDHLYSELIAFLMEYTISHANYSPSFLSVTCSENSVQHEICKENYLNHTITGEDERCACVATENIYNIGEETYCFENFVDDDSYGHCFGMAATSSGYYLGLLNKSNIGLSDSDSLYSLGFNETVKAPICHYQAIQGIARDNSIVAGGSYYKYFPFFIYNAKSDWEELVDYVKNHEYDNAGDLIIVYTKKSEGWHAINFLRYEVVDGQERIYAYDSNFPDKETYFYQDVNDYIRQAVRSTFSGSIDCLALVDVRDFFSRAGNFVMSKTFYAPANSITIEGAYASPMCVSGTSEEIMMYEILEDDAEVIITPLVENATFTYMGNEYTFDKIDEDTYAEFTLSESEEDEPVFEIVNAPSQECEHSYEEVRTEPTCTETGSITYTCYCGDTYSETIAVLGHTEEIVNEKAVTATTDGYTGDIVCSVCDELIESGKVIPATGTPVNNCDHMCHKSGFNGFIWKIVQFFWKLFKMNPVCECGAAHY